MMLAGVGCAFLVTALAWAAVLLCGSMVHKAVMRWATSLTPHEMVAEVAVDILARFPSILACILIGLGCATCGALSLCLGCFCYFLKVSKLYQEYLETLVKRALGLRRQDDSSLLLGVNFQLTLALLWLTVSVLNLHILLTWTKNLSYGTSLESDPSLFQAIVLCGCLPLLWLNDGKPRTNKKYYTVLAIILQAVAVYMIMFATITVFRMNFAITCTFVIVILHQLCSPARQEDVKEEEDESNGETVSRE